MKDGSFIRGVSHDNGVLNWRIDREFYLGLAEVGRYGGPPGKGKAQFTGFVEHPLGVVPIVGEVFVVKHGHRAFALLEDPDNLLVNPPTRQEPVPLEISWIIPMFTDYDDTIHGKFAPPKRYGLTDCLIDGNVFCFAYFLAQ